MFYLPRDVNFEILSNLLPSEILNIATINNSMNELCQDENFWEQYIKNRYNPYYYTNMEDGSFDDIDYKSPWDYLLDRSNTPIMNGLQVNNSWKILAIWIDKAKPIRSLFINEEIPGLPIIINNIQSLKSPYDKIRNCAGPGYYIYGDDLSIIYKNGAYLIKPLNKKFDSCDVSEPFPNINANTLLRDITIRGHNLLNYITTEVFIN